MESTLPKWVNKDFFEECLQKEKDNCNIVVTNLIVSSAVPPGNNYGSFLIRVKLDWKMNKNESEMYFSSFIVKAELTDGPMKDLTANFELNEPKFYYNFIPKAKQFSNTSFAARSFFSVKPTVTILEDLKEQGFLMADRTKLLDFDHCRLYMIAAALFHAVSVPVFKSHPELLENINKDLMFSNESTAKNLFTLMIRGGMKLFNEELVQIGTFKKYTKLVQNLTPRLWDMLVEAHRPSQVVYTMKQGDPWVTNMMFKYDKEGKVCDVKLIDFQGIAYGSPVSDVMFFLWTSANMDVKINHLEELYQIYMENFNDNLKQFNCNERLTYQQMMTQVKQLSPLALFVSGSFIPTLVHPDTSDMSYFFSEEDGAVDKYYERYYTSDYCANVFPQLLEALEVSGVFAYLETYKKSYDASINKKHFEQ